MKTIFVELKPQKGGAQINRPLQSFFTKVEDYKLNDLTIQGIPLVLHSILMYLHQSLTHETEWFEDKPFSSLDGLPPLTNVEEEIMFASVSEINSKYGIKQLIEAGFRPEEAKKIKKLCSFQDKMGLFDKLNKNEGISNNDFEMVSNIIDEFNLTNLPNFYKNGDIKRMFVLLKMYLLDTPNPILREGICGQLKHWNEPKTIKPSNDIVFKQFLKHTTPIGMNIIKKILSIFRSIIESVQLPKEESDAMYKCYFNALTHSNLFRKKYTVFLLQLFDGEKKESCNDPFDQIEGEMVIERLDKVVCPYYLMGLDDTLSKSDEELDYEEEKQIILLEKEEMIGELKRVRSCVRGTLFITTCRIVFIPERPLSPEKTEVLKYVGQCWIGNIKGIRLSETSEDGYYIKIMLLDLKGLTFKIQSKLIDFVGLIQTIQFLKNIPFETRGIPKELFISCSPEYLCSKEMKRMNIKAELPRNIDYYPKFPLFKPHICCEGFKERNAMIMFQTNIGSRLLRFPKKNNENGNSPINVELREEYKKEKVVLFRCKTKVEKQLIVTLLMQLFKVIASNGSTSTPPDIYYKTVNALELSIAETTKMGLTIAQYLMEGDNKVLLVPDSSINESEVGVFSSLAQIIVDPYYRTIKGFLELFQKEFIIFKYPFNGELPNAVLFCIFCFSLEMIIRQNIVQFEYDDILTYFIFTNLFSNRFSEFSQFENIDQQSSFIEFVNCNHNLFTNKNYSPLTEEHLQIDYHIFSFQIDRFSNYSKINIDSFTEKNIRKNYLSISGRQLASFPPFPISFNYFTDILTIDLSQNRLKEFPPILFNMTKLKEINLRTNNICCISKQISALTNLTFLDISENRLKHLPSFQNIPLKQIIISNNYFTSGSHFDFNQSLERLECCGMNSWCSLMSELSKLTFIDLSNSPRFDLSEFIAYAPPKLRELKLQKCELKHIPEEITKLIITKLDISNNLLSKMSYSFFQWETLVELDLTNNKMTKRSCLFKNMENLTSVKTSSTPKAFLDDNESPKYNNLKKIEKVIITGDELMFEVFQHLAKKMKDFGDVVENDSNSFLFEPSETKKKEKKEKKEKKLSDKLKSDGMSPRNQMIEFLLKTPKELEQKQWRLFRNIFIVCKGVETCYSAERVFEMILSTGQLLKTHFVTNCAVDEKDLAVYKSLKMCVHKGTTDKVKWANLPKKIFNQLVIKDETSPGGCGIVMTEFGNLDFEQYCLPQKKFEEIVHCLGLIEKEDIITKWLVDNGYLIKMPKTLPFFDQQIVIPQTSDRILVNYELFDDVLNVLGNTKTETGFFTVKVFEKIQIRQDNLFFVLTVAQQFGVAFILLKTTAEHLGLSKQFENVLKLSSADADETDSSGDSSSKSISSFVSAFAEPTRSVKQRKKQPLVLDSLLIYPSASLVSHESPFCGTPRTRFKTRKDTASKRSNGDLVLTFLGTSSFEENVHWPSSYAKNEVECGRIYFLKRMNDGFVGLINSAFSLKYNVQHQWKFGVIVFSIPPNEKEKVLMMVEQDLDKRRVIIRVRYFIVSEKGCFLATKMLKESASLLRNITEIAQTKITKMSLLCSSCLTKGEMHFIPSDTITQAAKKMDVKIKVDNCEFNMIISALDYIIEHMDHSFFLELTSFKFIKNVAVGSNSTVGLYETMKESNNLPIGTKVIIKIANLDMSETILTGSTTAPQVLTNYIYEYLREISFITFPKNGSVAQIYGFSVEPLMVVMEYFDGGSLFSILHNENPETRIVLTKKQVLMFSKQIAEGLNALHSVSDPILHRDVKSPNVVVRLDDSKQPISCAITDFGMSIPLSLNNLDYIECPYWLAPEVIQTKFAGLKSDVYSYGVVLWEMTTKQIPFNEYRFNTEVEEKVISGHRPQLNKKEKYLNDLIKSCWQQNPENRPTFNEIIKTVDLLLSKTK